ncbi:MAG: 50S ribosomal protein L30 [Aeromicrobium sp.]|jgi:large subunit ribosomal protein L30|nr:MAG: 50S ribosomal protein L30 [Aeromicrobium sp.]
MAKLEVTQIRSAIGRGKNQQETLRSLGLKRIGQTVIVEDRPELVGMVKTIPHLLSVKTVEEEAN